MAYFKLNNKDFSACVNMLKVATAHNYKQMTTAAGNTLVKYVNSKRVLEVGVISLDAATAKDLLTEVNKFKVSVTFLNPKTNALESFNGIIPQDIVEYYTIAADGTRLKAFILTINEL